METAIRWSDDKSRLLIFLLLPLLIWNTDCYSQNDHLSFCLFKYFTGRACYGCGLLRGMSAILHLDPARAIALNRLNCITIPLLFNIYLRELVEMRNALLNPVRGFPNPEKTPEKGFFQDLG